MGGQKRERAFALRVRIADRLPGALLALLVQGGFLLLMLQSVQVLTRYAPQHELMLVLPRLTPKPMPFPAAPRSGGVSAAPPIVAVPSAAPPSTTPPDSGALKGFGQSLFGCAPEAYATLTREQRTHCEKPGDNRPLTIEQELYPKSHSKDAAIWQEDLDERHFDTTGCLGAKNVMACQIQLILAEKARAAQARKFIAAENPRRDAKPPPPMSPSTGLRARW